MRQAEIELLQETLEISAAGEYAAAGRTVRLGYTPEEHRRAIYLPVEEVRRLCAAPAEPVEAQACVCSVRDRDSFEAACEMAGSESFRNDTDAQNVLVLNFANPVHPGGGVRHGARAQEEDLCRKSTLLCSLESEQARPYYEAHRKLHTWLATDAIVISPCVEVIRDRDNALLEQPVRLSVLTCAAPVASRGEAAPEELETLLYHRITGVLCAAAAHGYHYLVLGAWGCGAFGNDPKQVSRLFRRALEQDGWNRRFRQIVFAVIGGERSYNYRCFCEEFG